MLRITIQSPGQLPHCPTCLGSGPGMGYRYCFSSLPQRPPRPLAPCCALSAVLAGAVKMVGLRRASVPPGSRLSSAASLRGPWSNTTRSLSHCWRQRAPSAQDTRAHATKRATTAADSGAQTARKVGAKAPRPDELLGVIPASRPNHSSAHAPCEVHKQVAQHLGRARDVGVGRRHLPKAECIPTGWCHVTA